ncbi:hypothetical protein I79_017617 [Cricetulus griseus]|uniref:Uncharacterized protein n=1 Tax=Cricetulus griseus TaxID=10029 RepID=G3I2I4_CRIGR|nr:hypothetical protein I79_017617 [Cricetulus griseus]
MRYWLKLYRIVFQGTLIPQRKKCINIGKVLNTLKLQQRILLTNQYFLSNAT